jgi:hypothetical protein
MTFAQSFSEVLNAFSKFDKADAPNMSKIVAKFADLDGSYNAKIDALEATIDRGQGIALDGRGFSTIFKHNKRTVRLFGFDENDEGETYQDGVFWSYDEVRLKMVVLEVEDKPVYALEDLGPLHREWVIFVAENTLTLAEKVVEALQDGEFCELCSQGLDGTPGPVCRKCGLWEMEKPCRSCKRSLGRACAGTKEAPEHPCCKRRRVN